MLGKMHQAEDQRDLVHDEHSRHRVRWHTPVIVRTAHGCTPHQHHKETTSTKIALEFAWSPSYSIVSRRVALCYVRWVRCKQGSNAERQPGERTRGMRKTYDKLVRDRIPEIIREPGKACQVITMEEPTYQKVLRQKLVDEAQEVAEATGRDLVTELADGYEVLDALMRVSGTSEERVRQVQAERRAERGGFKERLLLMWTEDASAG